MNERGIMEYFIGFIIGLVIGALIVFVINSILQKQKRQEQEKFMEGMKESFGALSKDALSQNSTEFLKLADQTLSKQTQEGKNELGTKKQLIDQTLENMNTDMKTELKNVNDLVNKLEKDRENKFGELNEKLENTAKQTGELQKATNQLNAVLSNTKARGKWGERMADDILNLLGLKENFNYVKQKTSEITGKRPDYTFILPQDLKVNMDVKFPLDNYSQYLKVESESDKDKYKKLFMKDVRNRIKEVTTSREYINPEENTVDYVIVFIPNEQVYAFIHENDGDLLDESLKNKVILCSPITLYAVLAVIRQAVDNFRMEKRSTEILSLLKEFHKKWETLEDTRKEMGTKIKEAQEEFDKLTGKCQNQLGLCLKKIYDLREQDNTITQNSNPDRELNDKDDLLNLQ